MNLTEIIIDEKRAVDKESESSMAIVKSYIQKYGIDNVYLSFRESIHTSTINKNNRYGTPTGYYAFPLPYYFKNGTLDNYTWEEFVGRFPFAGNREYIGIFTITNKSGILYTSAPDTGKITQYVLRIKESYGKSTTGYSKISELCDSYLDNTWTTDYEGGFQEGNEVRKFWLFLHAVAALMLGNDRVSNTVSIIAKKIGLMGICDDAGLGMIHMNEKAQIVLFYGFMNIIGDFRVISSRHQRQDISIPIDNRDQPTKDNVTTFDKLLRFVEKKMGYKPEDIDRISPFSTSQSVAAQYLQNFKNGKAIPVRIRTLIGETPNKFVPYFINKDFKIGTEGITLDEIDGMGFDTFLRAAFINSNNPDSPKLMRCSIFNNNNLATAEMLDKDGYQYKTFVNRNGKPEVPKDSDLEWMQTSDIVLYLNTIAGYDKFRTVNRFSPTPDGRKLATAYFSKNSDYPFYINEKGEIDPNGYGLKISTDTPYIDLAIIINSKNEMPILTKNGINAVNERDNHVVILYDDSVGEYDIETYSFFDTNGKLDINGVNPDTVDSYGMLAGYFNQLKGVKIFKAIFPLYFAPESNTLGAANAYNNTQFFIDKTTGEPSIEGISVDSFWKNDVSNMDALVRTKNMIIKGLKIEDFDNSFSNLNPNYDDLNIFEGHERLMTLVHETIMSFLS